jgi:hypothetical protein
MKCPECGNEMEKGYLYVRGLGGALYWGTKGDTSFLTRSGLQQIDLSKASVVSPAAQAVLNAAKCAACGTVHFKAFP